MLELLECLQQEERYGVEGEYKYARGREEPQRDHAGCAVHAQVI